MGKGHAPSRSRRLLAEADEPRGRPVPVLMDEARDLHDASWTATTLARLAARPDAPPRDARRAWEDVRLLLSEVDRPSRLVEVLDEVLRVAPDDQRPPLSAEALRLVDELPDGEWTDAAVAACAPRVDAAGRQHLLRRALRNRGFEAEGCKAVVRAAPPTETARLRAVLEKLADPGLKARLLGHLAQQARDGSAPAEAHEAVGTAAQAAWSITDPARRTEALRVLAWQAPDVGTIDRLLESSEGHPAADVARFLTTLGARCDRLGDEDRTRSILLRAVAIAGRIPEPRSRTRVAERLVEAFERAGLDAEPARTLLDIDLPDEPLPKDGGEETGEPAPAPVTSGGARGSGRNVLAIVDGYSGGLRPPHLRALARAASLCAAFDLDLAVVGFPTEDPEALVEATTAETNIGEGARHAAELLATGRMHMVPWQKAHPVDWDTLGTPVATTPHPDAARAVGDLSDVPAPVCLLVGLGRQGLPRGLLHTAGHHYELTGKGISLETATAMGILAERLRTLGVRVHP